MTDDWDPNVIMAEAAQPCRIYGDDSGELFALVDAQDYQWLVQWRWSPKWSRGNRKVYLRRNVQESIAELGKDPDTGRRIRNRVQRTLFLHTAVAERAGILPPSEYHVLLDHRNGDGLDCRRENIRWVTRQQNRINIFGSHAVHMWE